MDSLLRDIMRSFLGIFPQEPPRNDFRNPIWGDDDEDEDELYDRSPISHHDDITKELNKNMEDMITSFEGIFIDGKPFRGSDNFNFNLTSKPRRHQSVPDDDADPETLRAYYLKPGFDRKIEQQKQDINLDGKISSEEISGILQNDQKADLTPINTDLLAGRSFCKTIITTRVTKPDGTVETHKIIQDGKDVTEETVITGPRPNQKGPTNVGMNFTPSIYNGVLNDIISMWKNLH